MSAVRFIKRTKWTKYFILLHLIQKEKKKKKKRTKDYGVEDWKKYFTPFTLIKGRIWLIMLYWHCQRGCGFFLNFFYIKQKGYRAIA